MHVILLGVGVFMAIVGAVLIRYGVPLDEYGNSPLLMSGMVALVGGLLLIALFMVARNLNRIAERLEIQPMPLPPIADISRSDPPPRPTMPPPPAARPEPAPVPEAAAPEPKVEPKIEPRLEPAPASAAVPPRQDAQKPGPLFGLFSSSKRKTPVVNQKVAPPPPPEGARVDLAPLTVVPEREQHPPEPPVNEAAAPKAAAPAQGAEVYKSGVIDGMAYTLYVDGSIEALLPQGMIRFASVEELQKYLVGKT